MDLSYLEHHGIKGQKKGHRRFQYKDGSLTPAGRLRYYGDSSDGGFMKKESREDSEKAIADGKKKKEDWDSYNEDYKSAHAKKSVKDMSDKELQQRTQRLENEKKLASLEPQPKSKLEKTSDVVNDAAKLVNQAKVIDRSIPKKTKRAMDLDLSTMSDKEMRDQINRALLERQYNDMFNPAKVSKGRQIVSTILEVGGGVLAAGAAAISIAIGIQTLRNKG